MKFLTCAFLLILSVVTVRGCYQDRPAFPPDNSPEHGSNRRKRSVQTTDVDIELSNFFTVCMHEKTGSVFASWRSIIDFVLRDTRWYSASEDQFCPDNFDRDPNSVRCWQGRLEKLVQLDSRLLPKAKDCIQEYQWSHDEEPFIIRGKRQTPARNIKDREECLGIDRATYSQCVQDKLLTRRNLKQYPSLTRWDGKSVEEFVLKHYSDCRIKSRYTFGSNVYTETCPNQRGPNFFPNPPKCISTIYAEIVRTPSPLFSAATTCTKKYTDDQCNNVRCRRPNQHCDKKTGRCVCDVGYQQNSQGNCVGIITDPCLSRRCGQNERCFSHQGTAFCVCQTGFRRINGVCSSPDPCQTVKCGLNEHCENKVGRGVCECDDGYTRRGAVCRVINPCAAVFCARFTECRVSSSGNPECVCISGHVPSQQGQGCVPENPCRGVTCRPNSQCVQGQCVCNQGLELNNAGLCVDPCAKCGPSSTCVGGRCVCRDGLTRDSAGNCLPDNVCEGFCTQNEICTVVNRQPRCECKEGFTLNEFGECRDSDPCDDINCPANMECRAGNCFCLSGFVKALRSPGCEPRVVDPCAKCGPSSTCVGGRCVCRDGLTRDSAGNCLPDNVCDGFCAQNEICTVVNRQPRCECEEGFTMNEFGECRDSDPCDDINCPANMECRAGNCFCLSGFVKALRSTGCEPRVVDPCSRVNCPPNSQCVTGTCICDPGFSKNAGEFCLPENKCASVSCRPNSRCVAGNCVCEPGFSKTPAGFCLPIDKCADVNCSPNSHCVEGSCECDAGFSRNSAGLCIKRDSCAGVQCGNNMVCNQGKCECMPGFVMVPEETYCTKQSGEWMEWSEWRECSKTCEKGAQIRYRQCDGMSCQGESVDSRTCNDFPCRTTGDCSLPGSHRLQNGNCVTCPSGKVFNQCPTPCYERCGSNPSPSNATTCFSVCRPNVYCICPPGMVERSVDDSSCIPRNQCPGTWLNWGSWVRCTQSCGGGVQLRSRSCRGTNCVGGETETQTCNTNSCDPSGGCKPPKFFRQCPTRCPKTCGNAAIAIACEAGCRQDTKCVCRDGLVEFSRTNTTCVRPSDCPGVCNPNPCRHGGQCTSLFTTYKCRCESGYTGKNCEHGCGSYCGSNGRCENGKCKCNPGYESNGKGSCRRIISRAM